MKRRNFVKRSLVASAAIAPTAIFLSGLVDARGDDPEETKCTSCGWSFDCSGPRGCCVQGGSNPSSKSCVVTVGKCRLVDIKPGEPGFPGKKVETYDEEVTIPAKTSFSDKCSPPCN